MCGFAGYLTNSISEDIEMNNILDGMSAELIHRGPDDQGSWVNINDGIAMGFCRLAILDLSSAGHQPMTSKSGRFVITYNGEIYNHNHLREKINNESIKKDDWLGTSDTETLLAAFELWGISKTLKNCIGMFSIALWDIEEKTLTLARDRFGEKPLYYGMVNHSLVYGSELKPFKKFPHFKNKISRRSLREFLKFNYVPTPLSIYQDIFKIEAGSFAQFKLQDKKIKQISYEKYWSLEEVILSCKENSYSKESNAIKDLEEQLIQSIKLQMQSDVPLGAFLSGGVDSSLIVSIMQKISDKPIKTFTVGFEDSEFDESKFAKKIANHLGTDHKELFVTSDEVRSIIPKIPKIYDEPFADFSQIPTHIVCKAAREHVTVALSGDAGDEIFAGYNRYFWGPSLWKKLQIIPFRFRKVLGKIILILPKQAWFFLEKIINFFVPANRGINRLNEKIYKLGTRLSWIQSIDDLYFSLISEWQDAPGIVIAENNQKELLPDNFMMLNNVNDINLEDPTERMMYQDSNGYLQDDILCKVDRAAMATSLETRVPFLDPEIVKLSWRFPLEMKVQGTLGKKILRKVLYKYVPKNLIERPKIGFGLPIGDWLRGPLKDWASDLLSPKRIQQEGYLNQDYINQAWNQHLTGKRDNTYKLWSVLMFQAWLEAERKS